MSAPGLLLRASWRIAFTLLLWVFIIAIILLIFKCIKTLAITIKNQGNSGGDETQGAQEPRERRVPAPAREQRAQDLPCVGRRYTRRAHAWSILLGTGNQMSRDNGVQRTQPYTISGSTRSRRIECGGRSCEAPPLVPRSPLTSQPDTEIYPPNTPFIAAGSVVPPPYSVDLPPAYDSLFPPEENKESGQHMPPV